MDLIIEFFLEIVLLWWWERVDDSPTGKQLRHKVLYVFLTVPPLTAFIGGVVAYASTNDEVGALIGGIAGGIAGFAIVAAGLVIVGIWKAVHGESSGKRRKTEK